MWKVIISHSNGTLPKVLTDQVIKKLQSECDQDCNMNKAEALNNADTKIITSILLSTPDTIQSVS